MTLRARAAGLVAAGALLFARSVIGGGTDDIVFTPIGDAYLQVGQIVNGLYETEGTPIIPIFNIWQQQAYAHVGYDALIDKRLDITISVGGMMVYSTPQILSVPATLMTDQDFLINSAWASYPLVRDSGRFSLTVQGGYFPYKYSPDVRNLGEYLFRANAYPMLVYSSFDYPQVRILGARIGMEALDSTITDDVILHSEVLGVPVQDWSIADILTLHLSTMLDIGGGVDFTHLLSVYPGPYNSAFNDVLYDYYYNVNSSNNQNFVLRTITTGANGSKDTVWADTLGWRSIKLMGRFSFDPKKALSRLFDCTMLGRDDGKIYGETDIIGLENYPSSNVNFAELYSRNMRTIYSMGINLPTFRLLDVANVEVEYNADTTSSFSDYNIVNATNGPVLSPLTFADMGSSMTRSPWRWSCYVKKTVCNGHVGFIAQAARDHTKINLNYWNPLYMSLGEALPASGNWCWNFKTEVKF